MLRSITLSNNEECPYFSVIFAFSSEKINEPKSAPLSCWPRGWLIDSISRHDQPSAYFRQLPHSSSDWECPFALGVFVNADCVRG